MTNGNTCAVAALESRFQKLIRFREAPRTAHGQSLAGEAITHLSQMPDEDILIEAPQIARLWNRLSLLGN